MARGLALVAVLVVAQAPAAAQILVSRLSKYFDDRVQNCTGPEHCDASTLGVLTGHYDEAGLYWGGTVSPSRSVRTAVCTASSDSMCLSWRVATADSQDNASQTQFGECQCEIPSSACAEYSSDLEATGTLVAGNTSRFSNGECDLGNYNGVCGWDGGDCSGYVLQNGTSLSETPPGPYELQGIGSDNFCAAWTCQLTSAADSSCSASRQRLRRLLNTNEEQGSVHDAQVQRRALDCGTSLVSSYSECACTSRSDNQLYCERWYCELVDVSFTWTTSDGLDGLPLTREWSECLAPNANDSDCASWEVVSQAADESGTPNAITLSDCSCVDFGDNADINQDAVDALFGDIENRAGGQDVVLDPRFKGCRRWECDADEYSFWEVSWALFGVAVGMGVAISLTLILTLPRARPNGWSCPKVKERCIFLSLMIAVCGVPILGVFVWMAVLAAGTVGAIVESILLFGPLFLCFPKQCVCGEAQQRVRQPSSNASDAPERAPAIQLSSVAPASGAETSPQAAKHEPNDIHTAVQCEDAEFNAEERVPVAVIVDADGLRAIT